MVNRMHGRHLAPLHQQHYRQQQLAHQSYVLDPATRHDFQHVYLWPHSKTIRKWKIMQEEHELDTSHTWAFRRLVVQRLVAFRRLRRWF
jgi:hypothetical protein